MKNRYRISGQSVITGMGHIVILVLLILAAIVLYAPIHKGQELRRDLEAAHAKLADLEDLYPLYAELVTMEKPADWAELQTPPMKRLTEPEVVSIPESFMALARESNIELSLVSPQVQKDAAGSRFLRVDVRGNGSYAQLKDLLMRMAQQPVLKRIQKLEVRREARQEQIHLIADLAIE